MEQSCSELVLLKRCRMPEGETPGAQGTYSSAHQIQPWFNFGDSRPQHPAVAFCSALRPTPEGSSSLGRICQCLPWLGFQSRRVVGKLCRWGFRSAGGCKNLRSISERSHP